VTAPAKSSIFAEVCHQQRCALTFLILVLVIRPDGFPAMTVRRETFSFVFQNSEVPVRSGWFGWKQSAPKPKPLAFPAEDVAFLRSFSKNLNRIGLVLPDRA